MELKPHKTGSGNENWSSLDIVFTYANTGTKPMKEGFFPFIVFPKIQNEPHQNIITWRSLNPSVNIAKFFMKDLIELLYIDTHTQSLYTLSFNSLVVK